MTGGTEGQPAPGEDHILMAARFSDRRPASGAPFIGLVYGTGNNVLGITDAIWICYLWRLGRRRDLRTVIGSRAQSTSYALPRAGLSESCQG